MITPTIQSRVTANRLADYERFEDWRRQHREQQPVLFTLDSLRFDLQTMGRIGPETWAQFETDEMTFLAENLNTHHVTPARYRFNGHDIIVAEAQANRPEITLKSINEGGLRLAQAEAAADCRYQFQLRRDQLFMQFHDEIVAMMQDENRSTDTIIKFSVFPIECETDERKTILQQKAYNLQQKTGFVYIARRLPSGELEMQTVRLDDCTPDIALLCLQNYGQQPLAVETSHEFGKYLVHLQTGQFTQQEIQAAVVAQFDTARRQVRGVSHSSYGRNDSSYDALQFIKNHTDHWAAYKAFNEQLARALHGETPAEPLLHFLAKSTAEYERAGSSVLSPAETQAVQQSLLARKLDFRLAAAYKKVLLHTNVSLFKTLFESYQVTGQTTQLRGDAHDVLGGYADAASASGGSMAAAGEGASGCGLSVSIEASAAQLAAQEGISLEEATRRMQAKKRPETLPPKHANDKFYLVQRWGQERVKPQMTACVACDKKRWVAICNICPDCDFKDTKQPGYVTRLIEIRKRRQQWQKQSALSAKKVSHLTKVA